MKNPRQLVIEKSLALTEAQDTITRVIAALTAFDSNDPVVVAVTTVLAEPTE